MFDFASISLGIWNSHFHYLSLIRSRKPVSNCPCSRYPTKWLWSSWKSTDFPPFECRTRLHRCQRSVPRARGFLLLKIPQFLSAIFLSLVYGGQNTAEDGPGTHPDWPNRAEQQSFRPFPENVEIRCKNHKNLQTCVVKSPGTSPLARRELMERRKERSSNW